MKLLLLAVFLAPSLQAQVLSIDFLNPKRDRVGDLEAAIKDTNSAAGRAGYDHAFTLWVSRSAEYMRIIELPNWASVPAATVYAAPNYKDHASELMRADFRIREANESGRSVLLQVIPALSLRMPAEVPGLLKMLWIKVRPDKSADYEAALLDLMPAVRKSRRLYTFGRVVFGDAQQYLLLEGLNDWSDLDKADPMQDELRAVRLKTDPMIIERRSDIYRYAPELSYRPAK